MGKHTAQKRACIVSTEDQPAIARILLASCLEITIHLHEVGIAESSVLDCREHPGIENQGSIELIENDPGHGPYTA
jgi:hypothetical protein